MNNEDLNQINSENFLSQLLESFELVEKATHGRGDIVYDRIKYLRDFSYVRLAEPDLTKNPLYADLKHQLSISKNRSSLGAYPIKLTGSILEGLVAPGLHLPYLHAEGADFDRAEIVGAKFPHGHFPGAQFYESNLFETSFFDCDLRHANFGGANLEGAIFKNAFLQKAHFKKAIVSEEIADHLVRGIYQRRKE